MQLTVIVEHKIKEGQLSAFVDSMSELIRLTKEEEGNIAYDLYEAQDGSGDVVLVELWESQQALDAHLQTDHFKELYPASDVHKSSPSVVRIYNRV